MTDRECISLLREDTHPVILGNGPAALRLFLCLRLLYGLSPLILSHRRGLAGTLFPFSFVPLVGDGSRLLCEQLCDFSERYENTMLLLFPTKPLDTLSEGEREALEARYILSEHGEIPDLLSPLLPKKSQRKATNP